MSEQTPEGTEFRLHVDDLAAIAEEAARTLLDLDIIQGGPTVGAALLNAADGPQRIRGLDAAFADRVVDLLPDWSPADYAKVRAAVLQTLREASPTT